MSSAPRTIERMKVLKDMGDGLLSRLYYLKGIYISKRKPACLTDAEMLKVRGKLEKKFPLQPETQKIPGWDLFAENAPAVLRELSYSFELMMDIVDFTTYARDALKDITVNIVDFKVRAFNFRCTLGVCTQNAHVTAHLTPNRIVFSPFLL